MKFRTRLYLGFGLVMLVMTIVLILTINMLSSQKSRMDEIVQDRYEKIKLVNMIRSDIGVIGREINGLVVKGEQTTLTQESSKSIAVSYSTINNTISELERMELSKSVNDILAVFKEELIRYKTLVDMAGNENVNIETELSLLVSDAELKRITLVEIIDELVKIQENNMTETLAQSTTDYNNGVRNVTIFTIIGILVGIGMAIFIVTGITKRLARVKNVMKSIDYEAEVFPRIDVITHDEIGEIASAYNEMATALEFHERTEREYLEDIEEQHWLKEKTTELSIMTQGITDLKPLGDQLIGKLAKIIQANYGVIYIRKNHSEGTYYSKLSSYAYQAGLNLEFNDIKPGEGLVGQVAVDNEIMRLQNIPDQYIKITSGLGEAKPSDIMIVPSAYEGEVFAVIELASLRPFTEIEQDLIQQVANQLAITINRIEKHMQVQALLEEAQTLNEELQTQSEELQMQQEELRTMNDELEAQHRTSEQKTKELETYKNELEEKNKEVLLGSKYKSEFLANMSHELRTPLNSLIILAQMLYENKHGNLSDKQVEYATTIYSSGNDLLRLINDILDLSKIESGKIDIMQGEVVLEDILINAERQFLPISKKKGIDFFIRKSEDVPAIVYSDEQRINQILKNLLSNAFKFTEKGNVQLSIEKTKIHSEEHGNQDYLSFKVSDTGSGIPQDKQDLIFEAFRQVDGTTSRKFGGTGLGLSISKELAELLEGYINLESFEGKGSQFTFYLPLHSIGNGTSRPNEQSEGENEAAASIDVLQKPVVKEHESDSVKSSENHSIINEVYSNKKVMVVDDDMRNVFALTSALESNGMNVIFCENGKEALELLPEHPDLDIILMDIMMPEMDGYETMENIRRIDEYKELPIIALTAKAMKYDRQKCIDAGASDYISKPVNLEQLLSLLKVWLHK
ncbi:response regulator [Litchfieldia alkalitelluris]|uniref:response regulator n=1 Tax=Litchfieldia alkalitelluris TaxID=304268 RepID=UPI000997ED04|nr:response regulator [Litchfieldia alkalitelluris]